MVHVVDYWVSQGGLVATAGQWQLGAQIEDVTTGLPESVRQMIERQISRLHPEEQRMLEVASVVGGEFLAAVVAAGAEQAAGRARRRVV